MSRLGRTGVWFAALGLSVFSAGLGSASMAAPAGASTTIGELQAATENCASNFVFIQIESTPTVPYAMPSAGVLTSWSHLADEFAGQEMSLLVFRTVAPNTYRLVGKSARENIQATQVNTFATRIPVGAGDTLGLRPSASGCLALSGPGHVFGAAPIHEPLPGADSFVTPAANGRLNVTAALEPDVDADGFGDETQDTGPTTQLTKVPRKKSRSTKAKIKFTADQQGVAFSCSLDGRPGSACGSPLKLKKLEPGRHRVNVEATDAAGFTGPPATASWKVRPR